MNLFQIFTLPLAVILFLRSVIKFFRGHRPRFVLFFGAVIWLVAAITIYNPNLTMKISKIVGIGRGADLILYLLVLTLFIVGFYFYNKIRNIESNISKIVRKLAIDDAIMNLTPGSNEESDKEKGEAPSD